MFCIWCLKKKRICGCLLARNNFLLLYRTPHKSSLFKSEMFPTFANTQIQFNVGQWIKRSCLRRVWLDFFYKYWTWFKVPAQSFFFLFKKQHYFHLWNLVILRDYRAEKPICSGERNSKYWRTETSVQAAVKRQFVNIEVPACTWFYSKIISKIVWNNPL